LWGLKRGREGVKDKEEEGKRKFGWREELKRAYDIWEGKGKVE
jgi:hypothetical protein